MTTTELETMNLTFRRGERVKAQAGKVRAVTFTESGQRVECYLPAGEYQIDGQCPLQVGRGCEARDMAPALVLFVPHPGKYTGVWYVSPRAV